MKHLKVLVGLILVLALMTACGNGGEKATTAETTTAKEAATTAQVETDAEEAAVKEASAGGWNIKLENSTQGAELSDVSVVLGYTGTGTEEFSKKAGEGKEFLLVKLLCEKKDGQEVIDWEKLIVTDKDGNEYKRIEDSFLTDLNMQRLQGTTLNFGTNEGFIAFEVNEGATGYTLSYPFEEGNLEIQF